MMSACGSGPVGVEAAGAAEVLAFAMAGAAVGVATGALKAGMVGAAPAGLAGVGVVGAAATGLAGAGVAGAAAGAGAGAGAAADLSSAAGVEDFEHAQAESPVMVKARVKTVGLSFMEGSVGYMN